MKCNVKQVKSQGSENHRKAQRNAAAAARHVAPLKELARIAAERQKFENWAHERKAHLEAAQDLSQLDLTRDHEMKADELEADLAEFYGPHLATVKAEAAAVQSRLDAPGLLAGFRRLFTGREDRKRLEAFRATIRDTEQRMQEAREKLAAAHAVEKARLNQLQEQRRQQQHDGIERARERKKQTLAARAAEAGRRALEAAQYRSRAGVRAVGPRPPGPSGSPRSQAITFKHFDHLGSLLTP